MASITAVEIKAQFPDIQQNLKRSQSSASTDNLHEISCVLNSPLEMGYNQNPLLRADAADDYLKRGLSVIPIQPRGKKPLLDWKPFQTRLATKDELREWLRDEVNIGIVTGTVSGLIVLDVDGADGVASLAQFPPLPMTWRSSTGRGQHYWFKHPGGLVRNFVKKLPCLDLRGDGGFVVVPPSQHVSGVAYTWLVTPESTPLAEAPDWLLRLIAEPDSEPKAHSPGIETGDPIPEGRRNETLYRFARRLKARNWSPDEVLSAVTTLNQRCEEPLDAPEVDDIVTKAMTQPNRPA